LPENFINVVSDTKDGKYRIDTNGGIIGNWLPGICFETTIYKGISPDGVH
jgi:hypothetical protein